MLIWTARLRKKKVLAVAILAALVAGLLVLLCNRSPDKDDAGRLDSEQARVDYLCELGWEVEPQPISTLQLRLPDPLAEPYLTYNKLQKEQGFDLDALCGRQVTRYTYAATNFPDHTSGVQINLYLCEGLAVAGDVMVTGENGFQTSLSFPK